MTTDNTSPRAGLDLDAIGARERAASEGPWHTEDDGDDGDGPGGVFGPSREYVAETYTGESSGGIVAEAITGGPQQQRANAAFIAHARHDVPVLLARVRDLTAKLDATAQAFDDLVAQVWRAATGETHEPPADVAALLRRVAEEHKALVGFRRAMLDVHEALDGVRPEPDFDMPAELGSYACDEVARLKAAVLPAGHVAVDRALYEAACRLAADVPRLQREVAAARREGAEAMREACAARAKDHAAALMDEATGATRRGRSDVANSFSVAASAAGSIATAIRALPLPGGEP